MGYSNEKAALNHFSELYKYCKENVIDQIKIIHEKTHNEFAILEEELPFQYESKNTEDKVPVASFDGGLATIFPGELSETKLIKVAGACPPNWKHIFPNMQQSMFHISSGILKWPEGAEYTEEEVIEQTISESLKIDALTEMFDHLGITADEYKDTMVGHLKYKGGNQVEDCYREILEWALIVNFHFRQKHNKSIDQSAIIPYLIVKDGSLYPFAKTLGSLLSSKIEDFLNGQDVSIIGMVKSSRFVDKDSSYRKSINKYLRNLKRNTFFQIPKKLEAKIDHRSNFYSRYFFSLFGGKSVYEVQIPKVNLQKDKEYAQKVMDIVNSQVTFNFGGSVSTNSYAHKEASLSENEARFLTDKLKIEINKELKNKKESEDV